MKRRTILLIALAAMIVLLGVLLYVPRKKNLDAQKEKEEIIAGEKNVAEVFNQAENILSYNGYTFIVDSEKNAIIRYSEKENQGKQIIYATNETIGNQLFVMGNKLIFNVGKNTYYSDLDGKNSSKITDGNIVYMDNDVYLYILQDTMSQYVCLASYNNQNLEKTGDTINIAQGNDIRYLKEYDKVLFFYSYNTNRTTTLFSVDLNNSSSNVLINLPTKGNDERYDFVDIAKVEDIVYPLQATYQISTDHETYSSNTVYLAYIDKVVWENYATNIKPLRVFTDGKKLFVKEYSRDTNQYEWFYRKYDPKDDIYVEEKLDVLDKNSKEYWPNVLYGDLTELFTLENGELKMDGLLFTTLENDYKNSTLKYAGLFSDKVYVLINQSGKNIWLRFDNDGSNPKKIYEYNK